MVVLLANQSLCWHSNETNFNSRGVILRRWRQEDECGNKMKINCCQIKRTTTLWCVRRESLFNQRQRRKELTPFFGKQLNFLHWLIVSKISLIKRVKFFIESVHQIILVSRLFVCFSWNNKLMQPTKRSFFLNPQSDDA